MLFCFFLFAALKKEVMKTFKKVLRTPLICWDIYAMHLSSQAKNFNKQTEIEILKEFQQKFNWCLDIETLLESSEFEALVLTDNNQNIKWVNKGFTKMTGYPANYTIGKKPNFLQGEQSSSKTRKNIRTQLQSGHSFKEEIINYRKDGKPYKCEIKIYPLKDESNEIVHHLALENALDI